MSLDAVSNAPAGQAPAFDVQTRVAGLWVYPVKSCAGVALEEVELTETGFDLDRAWMVVDAQGRFVSQREHPRMALVQPRIKRLEVVLRAPGMLALHLGVNEVDRPAQARIWNDSLSAWDMGDVAAQWFSDFLGQPGLRLLRFDPEVQRLAERRWTGDVLAPVQFADGFPLLVLSQGSLDELARRLAAAGHAPVDTASLCARFRPNILLHGLQDQDEDRLGDLHIHGASGATVQLRPAKPCPRCPMPNVDPATGHSSPEVMDTLAGWRAHPLLDGAISFGMNTILIQGVGQSLRVGDAVAANWRFD